MIRHLPPTFVTKPDWTVIGKYRLKFNRLTTKSYYLDNMVSSCRGWIGIQSLPLLLNERNLLIHWKQVWRYITSSSHSDRWIILISTHLKVQKKKLPVVSFRQQIGSHHPSPMMISLFRSLVFLAAR